MEADTINISRTELHNLVRECVREELGKIGTISDSEQDELEMLYGDSLYEEDYTKESAIRL